MNQTERTSLGRIKAASLFKISFWGIAAWFIPLCLFTGIMGCLGFDKIQRGEQFIHGFDALLTCALLGPSMSAAGALTFTILIWPGLWIYSKFKTMDLEHSVKTSEAIGSAKPTPTDTATAEQPRVPDSGTD